MAGNRKANRVYHQHVILRPHIFCKNTHNRMTQVPGKLVDEDIDNGDKNRA